MTKRFPVRHLLCLALASPMAAQAGDAVEKAIASYEKARSGTVAARGAALSRVAAHEDPRVTELLLRELADADDSFVVRVLQSIGQRPRGPGVLGPLRAKLIDTTSEYVRRAVSSAIGRQGSMGIDLLANLLQGDPAPPVREACFTGLAAAEDERAWRALAPFALTGGSAQQARVLRLFDNVPDQAAVTKMRLQLARDGDETLAAMAWRQLAANGHERTDQLFEDIVHRLGASPPPAARADLVRGLASILREEHFDTFRRLAATDAAPVRQAVRAVAKELGQNGPFVRWLIDSALGSENKDERELAMLVLREAPPEHVEPLLARLRKELKKPSPATLEAVMGLHELLAKTIGWEQDVLALTDDRDPGVRTIGLSLLLELGSDQGLRVAQKSVDAKQWELRSISFRYLQRFRDLSSIPLLIARVDKESGRLDAELSDALFAHAGVRHWRRSDWDSWWRKNKATHTLPPEQTIAAMTGGGSGGGGATVSYYGIPLISKRVAFLIDVSGSMNAKVGTDGKRTRLDEAKRQLRMVVEKLPDDHEFNVIVYETGVEPAWDELRRAKAKNKQEMLEHIDKLEPRGGTNIHDALEKAFADPQVDTIYLLSDGQPSAGRITDVQDLAEAVRRWNYQRQIVVHGIAVGTDSVLLKRLAAESGGIYVLSR